MRYKVLLVDDHPWSAAAWPTSSPTSPTWKSVAKPRTWPKPCRRLARVRPDMVVIDLSLRSGHGIDLIEKIKVHDPRIKTLVSSMHDETLFAERVLQAGAMGYITKQEPPEALVRAIRQVLRGQTLPQPAHDQPASCTG